MSARKLLLALAIIISSVLGYMLIPGPEERIAMLLRDGRHDQALAQLDRLLQQGRGNPNLVATFARLHDAAGTHARGAAILESYLAKQPDDPEALRSLVGLYDASEDVGGKLRALSKLVSIQPTRDRLSRLLGLYRLYGEFDGERELLARMWDSPLLEAAELERLGALLGARGELNGAVRALRRADELTAVSHERPRLLLFELLLKSGLSNEASQRAKTWLAQWKKPWVAGQLVRSLAANGSVSDTLELAATAVALHPDTRFFLARNLAEAGHRMVAAGMLADWPTSSAEPTADELAGYIAAANAVGDAAQIWRKFGQFLGRSEWLKAQATFAEILSDQYGIAAVAGLRPRLSQRALARRPLFAARLALHDGDPLLARRLLQSADLTKMSAAEKQVWLTLVTSMDGDQGTLRLLAQLRLDQRLPADLRAAHLGLAQKLQQTPEHLLGIGEIVRVASTPDGRPTP